MPDIRSDVLFVFKQAKPELAQGLTDDQLYGKIRESYSDLDEISFSQKFYQAYGEKLRGIAPDVISGEPLSPGVVIPSPRPKDLPPIPLDQLPSLLPKGEVKPASGEMDRIKPPPVALQEVSKADLLLKQKQIEDQLHHGDYGMSSGPGDVLYPALKGLLPDTMARGLMSGVDALATGAQAIPDYISEGLGPLAEMAGLPHAGETGTFGRIVGKGLEATGQLPSASVVAEHPLGAVQVGGAGIRRMVENFGEFINPGNIMPLPLIGAGKKAAAVFGPKVAEGVISSSENLRQMLQSEEATPTQIAEGVVDLGTQLIYGGLVGKGAMEKALDAPPPQPTKLPGEKEKVFQASMVPFRNMLKTSVTVLAPEERVKILRVLEPMARGVFAKTGENPLSRIQDITELFQRSPTTMKQVMGYKEVKAKGGQEGRPDEPRALSTKVLLTDEGFLSLFESEMQIQQRIMDEMKAKPKSAMAPWNMTEADIEAVKKEAILSKHEKMLAEQETLGLGEAPLYKGKAILAYSKAKPHEMVGWSSKLGYFINKETGDPSFIANLEAAILEAVAKTGQIPPKKEDVIDTKIWQEAGQGKPLSQEFIDSTFDTTKKEKFGQREMLAAAEDLAGVKKLPEVEKSWGDEALSPEELTAAGLAQGKGIKKKLGELIPQGLKNAAAHVMGNIVKAPTYKSFARRELERLGQMKEKILSGNFTDEFLEKELGDVEKDLSMKVDLTHRGYTNARRALRNNISPDFTDAVETFITNILTARSPISKDRLLGSFMLEFPAKEHPIWDLKSSSPKEQQAILDGLEAVAHTWEQFRRVQQDHMALRFTREWLLDALASRPNVEKAQEWAKGKNALVDKNGIPIPLFHISTAPSTFGVFKQQFGAGGFHFGFTPGQSLHLATGKYQPVWGLHSRSQQLVAILRMMIDPDQKVLLRQDKWRAEPKMYVAYGRMKNPIYLPQDVGYGDASGLIKQLQDADVFPYEDTKALRDRVYELGDEKKRMAYLNKELMRMGYDGIIYWNGVEGSPHTPDNLAAIFFTSGQIKLVNAPKFESRPNVMLEKGKKKQPIRGATVLYKSAEDPTKMLSSIFLFKDAKEKGAFATLLHETFHAIEDALPPETKKVLDDAFGKAGEGAENKARFFERYLLTQQAPSPELRVAFDQMRVSMLEAFEKDPGRMMTVMAHPNSEEARVALNAIFSKGASLIDTDSRGPLPPGVYADAPPPPRGTIPGNLTAGDVYDLYRSGFAGKGTAVMNALRSNLLSYTVDTLLMQPMSSFGHLLTGDMTNAVIAARTAKNQALYLVPSLWNSFLNSRLAFKFAKQEMEIADLVKVDPFNPVLRALFGKGMGGEFRAKAKESYELIQKLSTPEEAALLSRSASLDILGGQGAQKRVKNPTLAKRAVTGMTRWNLVFNILQDTMYRMSYEVAGHQSLLDTYNAGFASRGLRATRLKELLAISQGFDPDMPVLDVDGKPQGAPLEARQGLAPGVAQQAKALAADLLDTQINFINNKALKLTGAQRLVGSERPLTLAQMRKVDLDVVNNVARAFTLLDQQPVWGFLTGELFPRYRFGNFLMTLMETNPFTAAFSPRARRSLLYGGKKEALAERKLDFEKKLEDAKIEGEEAVAALEPIKDALKAEENQLKEWKRDGLYRPGEVAANMTWGPLLIGAGMWIGLQREERDEHDLGILEFRLPDGKIWNATQTLESLSAYLLIGDMIAARIKGSDRYQGPGKRIEPGKLEEIFLRDRYNVRSVLDLTGARTEDRFKFLSQEMLAELGKSMTTGAWYGDALRLIFAKYGSAEEVKVRDPKGFVEGMKANIPVLRTDLRDWKKPTTGESLSAADPLLSMLMGRVDNPDRLRMFLENHPGIISGSEVLYKRTGVEDYDNIAFEEIRKGIAKKVVPILDDESISHATQAARIKAELQSIRENAHETARKVFYREKRLGELPSELLIQQGLAEFEKEALKRHPGKEGVIPKWKRLKKYEREAIREAGKDYIMKMYEGYEPPQ